MTLISKTVMVRWNGFTREHYESKGYPWTKQNDLFECKIEDLQTNSTVKVWVECDYCGDPHEKAYRNLFKNKELIHKHCCNKRSCMVKKSEEVSLLKYGVTNYSQTQESKQHQRELYQTPKEEILKIANQKGLEILNIDDYENDRTRLLVICTYHKDKGIQETNFANIKKNKNCCLYGGQEETGKAKRLDGETVYHEFIGAGLIPMFSPEDYETNSAPMPYKCPKHLDKGIQFRQYSNLKYCEGCEYCSRERTNESLRNSEDEVFAYFKQRGLIVRDNQKYINKETYIYFECPDHMDFTQKTTFSNLQSIKTPCEYCRIEKSLSTLNRRLRSCLKEWKKESEQNSNYQCVLTGSKIYDIHHLYSFNSIIKDALSMLKIEIKDKYEPNEFKIIRDKVIELHKSHVGICIRNDLHILFHQMYGKINTHEQFDLFKQNYINKNKEAI